MPVVADKKAQTDQRAEQDADRQTQTLHERRFEKFDASQLKAPEVLKREDGEFLSAKGAQRRFSRVQASDVRATCPVEIPSDAKVHYEDQNGGNVKMDRGYRQIEFSWRQNGDDYYARWHTKEHDGLKDDRPLWRVSRRQLGRGQSSREELIALKDGSKAFIPSSVFRQAQRFLRNSRDPNQSSNDPNRIQLLREAAIKIISRVHFHDEVTKPTRGEVPWQKGKVA